MAKSREGEEKLAYTFCISNFLRTLILALGMSETILCILS